MVTDLDLILDNATYFLSFQYNIQTAHNQFSQWPIEVYLRETYYPFNTLTQIQTYNLTVSPSSSSSVFSSLVLNFSTPLIYNLEGEQIMPVGMDLSNYASLVINFAPPAIQESSVSFQGSAIKLQQMTLASSCWKGTGFDALIQYA